MPKIEALETMEHLLYMYICDHYSAKNWALLGQVLTLSLSRHTGEYILAIALMVLEIVFHKPHPSILLHLQNSNMRKVDILLLQEARRNIIFRHVHLQVPRGQEELQSCIQAHLLSGVKKSQHF